MKRNKTAAGVWLTGAALVLALFCPLPVPAAARVAAAIPATVRTEGADSAAVCTVELTPLDNAPAPAQCRLTVKNGGTAYFTGLGFDAPGDYRYRVAELKGSAANTSYDAGVYTVTVRVTSKKDGTLAAEIWAVRSGETAKADGVAFVNRCAAPGMTTTTATVTLTPTPAQTAQTKAKATAVAAAAAVPALPRTGDTFPVEALAAAFCAGVVGFGTAWNRRR